MPSLRKRGDVYKRQDKGMCADWSIHDKNDGNPHVHLLVTMRPFNLDHSWGNKEVKDWDFVRDTDGNIVVDESHPDWWQDKKNPCLLYTSRCV